MTSYKDNPQFDLPNAALNSKVALLGGSFNPPHIGHALLALSILSVVEVDALWVLPCADHPFGKELASFRHRFEMCKRAFSSLKNVHILDVEAHMPAPSFTVQTLRALKNTRKDLSFSFIVGTDILNELHLWREPDALQKLCELIVVPRGGYPKKGQLELILPEVSSSEVRTRLRTDQNASALVDKKVMTYLQNKSLYIKD